MLNKDGAEIESVKHNGVDMDVLKLNGVEVWSGAVPDIIYLDNGTVINGCITGSKGYSSIGVWDIYGNMYRKADWSVNYPLGSSLTNYAQANSRQNEDGYHEISCGYYLTKSDSQAIFIKDSKKQKLVVNGMVCWNNQTGVISRPKIYVYFYDAEQGGLLQKVEAFTLTSTTSIKKFSAEYSGPETNIKFIVLVGNYRSEYAGAVQFYLTHVSALSK